MQADLAGASKDPGVGRCVHLVPLRKSQMQLEVTLHAAQRTEVHGEQVHPAGRLCLGLSGAFPKVLRILFTGGRGLRGWPCTMTCILPPRLAERTPFGKPDGWGVGHIGAENLLLSLTFPDAK